MCVEAKQIQNGAALSRGEKKLTFFPLRCPHSPPSEMRLAWSELTAARSYLGLLSCSWTLWTSRLFAFLRWCKARHVRWQCSRSLAHSSTTQTHPPVRVGELLRFLSQQHTRRTAVVSSGSWLPITTRQATTLSIGTAVCHDPLCTVYNRNFESLDGLGGGF